MMHVECPWCAGPATVEVAERGEFECADCADPRRARAGAGQRARRPRRLKDGSARLE